MKQLFVDKVNVKGLTLEQVIQNNTSQYAPKANPTFTGTVTAPTIKATNLTVSGLTLEQVIKNNTSQYAPKANPTFTGTITAPTIKATNLTVSGTLNIPGGQIWIE